MLEAIRTQVMEGAILRRPSVNHLESLGALGIPFPSRLSHQNHAEGHTTPLACHRPHRQNHAGLGGRVVRAVPR